MHITYFLLILFSLNTILFVAARKLYFGNYLDYSLDFNSYLLSDSHGEVLKDITEKYGVYNFSADGDSYFDVYRKINWLISRKRIDTIYIAAGDHTLSPYREELNNMDRSIIFTTPKEHSNYYEFFKARYLKYYVVLFQPKTRSIINSYIIYKIKNTFQMIKTTDIIDETVNWVELSADERLKSSENRLQRQFSSDIGSDKLKQSLVDIMNVCRKNNIVLIGIKFPLSSEYSEILGNKTYGGDEKLRLEGFKVLDYKNVYMNHSRYFKDQDHLNEEGSYNFTELLFYNKEKYCTDDQQ